MDIAIYGAGGFGRETALMIEQINKVGKKWNLTGFYDDGLARGTMVDGLPVLGGLKDVNALDHATALALAIADPAIRKKMSELIVNPNISYPVLAHPTVLLGDEPRNHIGKGTIITAQCILTTNVILGDFCIINLATNIGHDVRIGNFCSIMPGCSISGFSTLGEGCMVGTGARLIQSLTIGSYCKIGAGAVVTKNYEEDSITLVGVPAVKVE